MAAATSLRPRISIPDRAPLSAQQKALLAVEIVAEYGRARWWLGRRGLPAALEALRGRPPGESIRSDAGERRRALRLAGIVTRTLAAVPAVQASCLMRSLVLTGMLARRGVGTSLIVAVRGAEDFGAHAWIEWAGQPLLPPAENRYERLAAL
jgi:hypothetical protein